MTYIRAGVYCRISRDTQGDRAGVERQEQDCRRLAEQRGWHVAEVYVDNDISAASGTPRPAYRRMLDDIASRRLDAVVTWATSRLHRRPSELEEFFAVCDTAGVTRLASVAGDRDLEHDRMMLRIMAAVDADEVRRVSERVSRQKKQRAERGVTPYGPRLFGFEADHRSVRQSEAAVLQEVAGRILAGDSLRQIALDLRRRGVRSAAGGAWYISSLGRLLRNPRLAGLSAYKGQPVAQGSWPAILPREQWERMVAVLDGRRVIAGTERPRPGQPAKYLLSGIAVCGRCGQPMSMGMPARNGSNKTLMYRCVRSAAREACGRVARQMQLVDSFVIGAVLERLERPDLAVALADARGDSGEQERQARARLLEATSALEELEADYYTRRTVSRSGYLRARGTLDARVRQAQADVDRLLPEDPVALPDPSVIRQVWPDMPLEWRRQMVRLVLVCVRVHPAAQPGRRLDTSLLELVPRC